MCYNIIVNWLIQPTQKVKTINIDEKMLSKKLVNKNKIQWFLGGDKLN